MFQILVTSDALQLVGDNLFHLLLDAPVIRLHHFLHAVVAVRVREVGNDGYRLVGFLLALHFLGIHDNLTVENLLLDTLVEVVGHRTDEHPLRQEKDYPIEAGRILREKYESGLIRNEHEFKEVLNNVLSGSERS